VLRFQSEVCYAVKETFRPHKVYIFLIRITCRVDLAMSLYLSVRMNAEISETTKARKLGLGMQIPELPAQRKFISARCKVDQSTGIDETNTF